ncbi:DMT family transporter [Victivallis sp. Marseille-Q1083]|uniref:DMT family transporter n=1 Tax=Victivallis sp. Marseille-Q1083 TaxID=2717288 RepID=UPI00158BEC52|nr:DMT family transporter [Victivallis sp. Marseille-Q1083]
MIDLPAWLLPILCSALALGIYDLCKKHAVRDNSVMPVLFFATFSGTLLFVAGSALSGNFTTAILCTPRQWWLLAVKSLLVGTSWTCVYYAMRELPISIASPIRASAPLWTFLGSLLLFGEIPTVLQGVGMLAIFLGYYLFSILGLQEGISFRKHRGVHLIILGTVLGAISALYDKYLLNVIQIPRDTVQLWFSLDLVVLLGGAYLIRRFLPARNRPFQWRWSIPLTGILLVAADYLYFYAVSLPDIHISILSLVRRGSCVVTFVFGVYYFHDRNVRRKAWALALILLGVLMLALAQPS